MRNIGVLFCLILILIGCQSVEKPIHPAKSSFSQRSADFYEAWEEWRRTNPCGSLTIKRPVFNISGYISEDVKPNTTVYLFITPNTTLNSSLYVVQNCRYIIYARIDENGSFEFKYLPVGQYVAMVRADSFYNRTQDFPRFKELQSSNCSLDVAFIGGDPKYSISAFSISPLHKPKNIYSS